MTALSWIITLLVIGLLAAFVWALISLRRIPLGERPKTRIFDRFGHVIGDSENPDYHENPGEVHSEDPDLPTPGVARGAAGSDSA